MKSTSSEKTFESCESGVIEDRGAAPRPRRVERSNSAAVMDAVSAGSHTIGLTMAQLDEAVSEAMGKLSESGQDTKTLRPFLNQLVLLLSETTAATIELEAWATELLVTKSSYLDVVSAAMKYPGDALWASFIARARQRFEIANRAGQLKLVATMQHLSAEWAISAGVVVSTKTKFRQELENLEGKIIWVKSLQRAFTIGTIGFALAAMSYSVYHYYQIFQGNEEVGQALTHVAGGVGALSVYAAMKWPQALQQKLQELAKCVVAIRGVSGNIDEVLKKMKSVQTQLDAMVEAVQMQAAETKQTKEAVKEMAYKSELASGVNFVPFEGPSAGPTLVEQARRFFHQALVLGPDELSSYVKTMNPEELKLLYDQLMSECRDAKALQGQADAWSTSANNVESSMKQLLILMGVDSQSVLTMTDGQMKEKTRGQEAWT